MSELQISLGFEVWCIVLSLRKESDPQPELETEEGWRKRFCSPIVKSNTIALRVPGYLLAEIQVDFTEGTKFYGQKCYLQYSKSAMHVLFSKNLERKGPSMGVIQPTLPHEHSPHTKI